MAQAHSSAEKSSARLTRQVHRHTVPQQRVVAWLVRFGVFLSMESSCSTSLGLQFAQEHSSAEKSSARFPQQMPRHTVPEQAVLAWLVRFGVFSEHGIIMQHKPRAGCGFSWHKHTVLRINLQPGLTDKCPGIQCLSKQLSLGWRGLVFF